MTKSTSEGLEHLLNRLGESSTGLWETDVDIASKYFPNPYKNIGLTGPHLKIPAHLSWGKIKKPGTVLEMKNINEDDFKRDCIDKVTKTLEACEVYTWVYVMTPKYYPEVSLRNMLACATHFLNESELEKHVNAVVLRSGSGFNLGSILKLWFIDSMSQRIADDEWEAYDHDYAMGEL